MVAYTILHLSDLHFGCGPLTHDRLDRESRMAVAIEEAKHLFGGDWVHLMKNHDPDLLESAVFHIRNQWNRFHGAIVTGDLATTGLEDDLELALGSIIDHGSEHDFPYDRDWKLKAGLFFQEFRAQKQLILFPGNHDRYFGRLIRPGGTLFDTKFGQHWGVGRGVSAYTIPKNPEETEGPVVVILAADFTLTNRLWNKLKLQQWAGMGEVDDTLLKALRNETRSMRGKYAERGCAIIWAIHFHPLVGGSSELQNGKDLVQAALDDEIDFILGGHTHSAEEISRQGANPETPENHDRPFMNICGSTTQAQWQLLPWKPLQQPTFSELTVSFEAEGVEARPEFSLIHYGFNRNLRDKVLGTRDFGFEPIEIEKNPLNG